MFLEYSLLHFSFHKHLEAAHYYISADSNLSSSLSLSQKKSGV